MTIRVIDYKKINLTDSEWELYQAICKSYDLQNFQGKSLFSNLFETDSDGLITFLRPPVNYSSMEVYLFLASVFLQQHVRAMYGIVATEMNRVKEKEATLDALIEKANKLLENK